MTLTADPPHRRTGSPEGLGEENLPHRGRALPDHVHRVDPGTGPRRPVLDDPGYVLGPGPDVGILWGGFLEVITALACIGTAIVLFPILRRQNETTALGFVASRTLEAATIVVGVVTLLAVVTLRQDLAGATGAEATSLVVTGRGPGRRPHLDVPARPRIHGGRERPAARQPAPTVPTRAPGHPRPGTRRRPPAARVEYSDIVPAPTASSPSGRPSPPFRSSSGSCRWASGSWSRASHPPR